MLPVSVMDYRGCLLVAYAGEDARRHLDHRGPYAELRCHSGDLEADQATADHEQVLALTERSFELLRVSFGTQVVDVRCAERELGDFTNHRAGRDHQRVIVKLSAVMESDRFGGTIDGRTDSAGFDVHVMCGQATRAGDEGVLGLCLTEQHRFRERRLLVRVRSVRR